MGRAGRPRVEIGIDCLDPVRLAPFWETALGYKRGHNHGDPYLDLLPPDGSDAPVVFLQRVPAPKTGKNRLHLDLYTTAPEELVERLVDMGGERAGEPQGGEPGGWSFQVMLDPAGNEFCVCRES